MIRVLTAEQMREVDRLTTERYGIPSILLMENAAHAVEQVIAERLGGTVDGKSFLVLCGPGNNGGDGAALARILLMKGAASVYAAIVGKTASAPDDAQRNFEILRSLTEEYGPRLVAAEVVDEPIPLPILEIVDVVVDAVFGTGLTRPVKSHIGKAIESLDHQFEASVRPMFVSVDMPSGLASDTGMLIGGRIKADVTVTFTAPKPANVLAPACSASGDLVIADIGSPQQLIDEQPSQLFLAESSDVTEWLEQSKFTNASYKNKRGHALIVGGSRDYSGAAVLAGNAGIRSGVGLVTLSVPEDSRSGVIGRVTPEVMVRGISQTEQGSAAEKAADEIAGFLKNVDAVAIGCGLSSKEDQTKAFVRRIVEERQTPVLIDADGLTSLSPWATNGPAVPHEAAGDLLLILTPHEGEFKKLLGVEGDEANNLLNDRAGTVRNFATKHNVILVLKGERNLIGAPDGRVVVNPTGNAGLGKAGNGDTLTGILAGFIAQAAAMKLDIFGSVVAAVYVAGMAGDIAERKFGKRVMTASDVRDSFAEVFASFEQKPAFHMQ